MSLMRLSRTNPLVDTLPVNVILAFLMRKFSSKPRNTVRTNGHRKGAPNMTSEEFARWVNMEFNVSIHEESAKRWLLHIGFGQKVIRVCTSMAMRGMMM